MSPVRARRCCRICTPGAKRTISLSAFFRCAPGSPRRQSPSCGFDVSCATCGCPAAVTTTSSSTPATPNSAFTVVASDAVTVTTSIRRRSRLVDVHDEHAGRQAVDAEGSRGVRRHMPRHRAIFTRHAHIGAATAPPCIGHPSADRRALREQAMRRSTSPPSIAIQPISSICSPSGTTKVVPSV